MKRSPLPALIIGAVAGAAILALHLSGAALRLEQLAVDLLTLGNPTTRVLRRECQYLFVVVAAVGIAWLTLETSRRKRMGWIVGVLILELAAVTWVCSLYQTVFQPLPSIFAAILGFSGATGFAAILRGSRPRTAALLFTDRISREQLERLRAGDAPLPSAAQAYETTAVVCDIANKHDLAEECAPAVFADLTERFIAHAARALLEAGAYLEAAGGEGVVAIFGFPMDDPGQAETATRQAMGLLKSFEKLRESGKAEPWTKFDVHIGISSGRMIVAPLKNEGRAGVLASGEPIELARRFCIANRFYGSRILIGPRTFEMASKMIVARPIDFLSGVDVRERHEIYEPLALATEGTPEQLARRDCFWNGVVLYREKRWAEAYSQFQKARGPNEYDDAPLQLYLRRLEPLALHLMESPFNE